MLAEALANPQDGPARTPKALATPPKTLARPLEVPAKSSVALYRPPAVCQASF